MPDPQKEESSSSYDLRIQPFRDAVEYSAIGIATVGLDGSWITLNKALCDLLGYTQEELLGRTFQDITHPEDLNADLENVGQMLAGKLTHYHMEKRYFHKDGRVIWVILSVSLVGMQIKNLIFSSRRFRTLHTGNLSPTNWLRALTSSESSSNIPRRPLRCVIAICVICM